LRKKLKPLQNIFLFNSFDPCDCAKNGIKRAEPQRLVVGNGKPVMLPAIPFEE
jgi:hypothetical protein